MLKPFNKNTNINEISDDEFLNGDTDTETDSPFYDSISNNVSEEFNRLKQKVIQLESDKHDLQATVKELQNALKEQAMVPVGHVTKVEFKDENGLTSEDIFNITVNKSFIVM